MQAIPFDVRQSTGLYDVNRLSNVRWYELPISSWSSEIRSITTDPPHTKPWVCCLPATLTLISLKLKDITQRSCQYPHFVTKPYRFTPDELLCTVFIEIGDYCFIDTQVLLFHESKVSQESLIFHAQEGTYFRHLVTHIQFCVVA